MASWIRTVLLSALAASMAHCSLTQSLDDLKGGSEPDASAGGATGGASGGSGGTDSGIGGTITGGTGGKGGTGGSGATDSATGGAGGSVDAGDPCWTDPGGCSSCCVQSHQQGETQFVAAIQTCVCQTGGACAAPCQTYCTGGMLDTACNQCVSSSEVQNCIGTHCGSSECKAYFACVAGC